MTSFKVKPNNILPFLCKYGFKPELYFDIEQSEGEYAIYSVHESDFDLVTESKYKYKRGGPDLKEFLAQKLTLEKKTYKISDDKFEELLFLIFYVGVYRYKQPIEDVELHYSNYTLINILQALILTKEHGPENIVLEIKPAINKKKGPKARNESASFNLDLFFSSYERFFKSLADLLAINSSYFKNQNLNIRSLTIEKLIELKHSLELAPLERQDIAHTKGILLILDFLRDIGLESKGLISYEQAKIIYFIYHQLGWFEKPDFEGKYLDRFIISLKRSAQNIKH